MLVSGLFVTLFFAVCQADLGDINPPWGTWFIIDADAVNVRDEPGLSSNVIGTANRNECFKYLALRLTLDGYIWFKVDFRGQDGWIAGAFMILGDDTRCASSCGSDNTKVSDAVARGLVTAAGIPVYSSCGCSDRYTACCTSLEQIRCKCITDIIWFKETSGCAITITGGTEIGHAAGDQSHWNGYKLDISLSSCVNGYIQSNFPFIGYRPGDGAALYEDPRRNVYALEGNHWDITYP